MEKGMKKTKRWVMLILVISMLITIVSGCGTTTAGVTTQTSKSGETAVADTSKSADTTSATTKAPMQVKIGVAVYDTADTEVKAFQDYYLLYIAKYFTNVEFVYSSTIDNTEKEIAFIESCKAQGVQGIISFVTQDTVSAINKCSELKMYYIKGAGSVSTEIYEQVKSNPYFLGTLGPSLEMEKTVGYDMAKYFLQQNNVENKNIVIHAGYIDRVEMHRYRLSGIVKALAEVGITYSRTDTESTTELGTFDVGTTGYTIDIFKGVPIDPGTFFPMVSQKAGAKGVQVLMSVLSGYDFLAAPIKGAEETNKSNIKVSAVCSFTESYKLAFAAGDVDYISAKYAALSGPVFAAMYNAITGYAEDFRDNGNAFQLEQGYWVAASNDEYLANYTLATSLETPAYTEKALKSVIKEFNPDATFDDLKALSAAWDLKDVKARLNNEA